MRRLVSIAICIIICVAVIQDIRGVVLPQKKNPLPSQPQKQETKIPYKALKVSTGETVLSIVSELNASSTPQSLQIIIEDFEKLNPSISANDIVDGVTYKFPLYALGE